MITACMSKALASAHHIATRTSLHLCAFKSVHSVQYLPSIASSACKFPEYEVCDHFATEVDIHLTSGKRSFLRSHRRLLIIHIKIHDKYFSWLQSPLSFSQVVLCGTLVNELVHVNSCYRIVANPMAGSLKGMSVMAAATKPRPTTPKNLPDSPEHRRQERARERSEIKMRRLEIPSPNSKISNHGNGEQLQGYL